MSVRYALYFSPVTNSCLAAFGAASLGRSATLARATNVGSPHPNKARWLALTQPPAHYGFHATLKAPFELRSGTNIEALTQELKQFARELSPIPLEGLAPRQLSGFAALTLPSQPAALRTLAQKVVETFEPYRQPLSDTDIQRRKKQQLTPRQTELLEQYGYPYVDEEFRFHMTLTGPITEQDNDYVEWLKTLYRQFVTDTPMLDQITIYSQPDRNSPFVKIQACPLATAGQPA
ncbi:DUF1045 domain-containing protein [Granulosicoccus antarcticus]|uniref:Phosphonate metabolism protein n=1 Tax=Granulosicoccus antarcticus IMCC3135 TaxID=1192854 RepID=A0A2Z2NNX4_9GAMM|nr:DUF1045 domain-containing protein [Granulosicoccus antarcticus]ASJ70540.1 hypothetical protein IMCC3135_02130 [Granulosicoccus antarcticus IMCC3135]